MDSRSMSSVIDAPFGVAVLKDWRRKSSWQLLVKSTEILSACIS